MSALACMASYFSCRMNAALGSEATLVAVATKMVSTSPLGVKLDCHISWT